jgi:Spy/CpxP family protein refolding chaperone
MHEHKERARRLGAEVVAAERALDRLFSERRADAAAVSSAAEQVGLLRARLRADHLNTHLLQTALLSSEQVRRYTELRGYAARSTPSGNAPAPSSPSNHHRNTH